jgi:hypothetical protein
MAVNIKRSDLNTVSGQKQYPQICQNPGVHTDVRKQNVMGGKAVSISEAEQKINEQSIYNYLRKKGVSHIHSVGIVNNIFYDSGFKSDVIGDFNTSNLQGSGGLFQHNGIRFDQMYCSAGDNWRENWSGQIDYALGETEMQSYLQKSFGSEESASKWFTQFYRKPNNPVAEANNRLSTVGRYKKLQNSYSPAK